MARKLIVEVLADVTSFSRNLKEATVVSEQFSSTVTGGTKAAAQAVVAASVKTTESLRAQAVAYREIAAAAAVGSEEQIAAARLAEKAELRLATAMGVTAHEADQLRVHSAGLNRELSHGLRGVASGTGIMHGFGRSLAFASGGFIAFEGASRFLTDSISAAREAGQAQRSLAAQMKASGESFAANREQIDRVALSYGKFGFQNDEVVASLTVLERGTGNINRAIQLQGLTADIARAKNIDLAAAANVVAKVFGGQETALRRAVPGLERNAHGLELIRLAQAKLAGQAAANTTVSERFAATLHNTEEIVGTALLPILNQYLTSLSKWLDQMNRTGQLQRDVAGAVKLVTGTINAAKTALDAFNSVTGSTKDTVKALFGVFVAFKTLRLVSWFDGLTGSIKGAGAAATVAEGETAALSTGLGGLTAAPWVITVLVAYKDIKDPGSILDRAKTLFDFVKKGSPLERALENLPNVGPLAQAVRQAVGAFGRGGSGGGGNLFSPGFKLPSFGLPPAPPPAPHDLPVSQAALPIVGRAGLTGMQANQLALAAAARTKSTTDNLAALVTQRELLAKAIRTETARLNQATTTDAAKKFAANLQHLYDQDAAAMSQIQSLTQKAAQQRRTPAEFAGQRNTWFDTMIDRQLGRIQDIKTLQGQNARLTQIAAELKTEIAKVTDVTRKATLLDKLADVVRTRGANRQQIRDQAKQVHDQAIQDKLGWLQLAIDKADLTKGVGDNIAAEDKYITAIKGLIKKEGDSLTYEQALLSARQARRGFVQQAAQDRQTTRENRQFAGLGLGPGGADLVPSAAALRGRLGRLEDAVTGTFLDTTKTSQLFKRIQRVLLGNFGTLTESVRSEIKQMLDTVSQQFDQKPAAKKTRHNLFTALGLTLTGLPVTTIYNRADYETLRRTWTPGMGVLRFGHGSGSDFSLGRSVTINGGVHVHGIDNPRKFMDELEKMQRGKPHTRRGSG